MFSRGRRAFPPFPQALLLRRYILLYIIIIILLREGLNTVTRALPARSPKQILVGILLSASEDRVRMTCSDGSLVIECTNAAVIKEEGQAVLPG